MKKNRNLSEMFSDSMDQGQNSRDMMDPVSCLENRITKITARLSHIEHEIDSLKTQSMNSDHEDLSATKFNSEKAAIVKPFYGNNRSSVNSAMGRPSNIIPFPGGNLRSSDPKNPKPGMFLSGCARYESDNLQVLAPFQAIPGLPLPPDVPDYRPFLQRDGLILLAWDKRATEMGERYTAYWVTSAGIPRFYASKPCSSEDFSLAQPDHKSYAAEDGIEFYGQEAPVYLVHVAPELMMSNPRHSELRLAHIMALKHQGSKVDFNYKYLLTMEKHRSMPPRKPRGDHSHRAGA